MSDIKGISYNNVYRRLEEPGAVNKGVASPSASTVHPAAPPCVQPAVYPPGDPLVHNSGNPSGDHGATFRQNEPSKLFNDAESQLDVDQVPGFDFSEKSIRRSFIRKVYSVLMCQLLITVSVIAVFIYCSPVKQWVTGLNRRSLKMVLLGSMGVSLTVLVVMLLCDGIRRRAPMNFIFLGVFTVVQGVMIGILAALISNSEVVLVSFGITAAICFALTLYAFQTKRDYTGMGGALLVFLLVLIIFGCIAGFLPRFRTFHLLFAGVGVLIFSFYIVYDTQLMIGGGHKYSISPEDYIFAALNLYLDIINLFLYILRFFIGR